MNFLIDVHLPISLSKYLNSFTGCSAVHVNQILQKWNTTDQEISRYADERSLVVITKDSDFKDSHFIRKSPKRLIRITLGNLTNTELQDVFSSHLPILLQSSLKDRFYIEISKNQIIVID